MDNRINEIRRKITVLRADMVRVEQTMHDQTRAAIWTLRTLRSG
jgi:translation initiation factor IF-1